MRNAIRLFIVIIMSVLLGSCKTVREVEHTRVTRDTVYMYHNSRDSIFHKDSVSLHEWVKGDTVYIVKEKWSIRYQERGNADSAYIARRDSTGAKNTALKGCAQNTALKGSAQNHTKGLTKWELILIRLGKAFVVVAIGIVGEAALCLWLLWRRRK